MAKQDTGFEQMMNIWQEGQDAFFKVQKDVMENFQKSLADFGDTGSQSGSDAMAAWKNLIQTWAPSFDPSKMTTGFDSKNPFTAQNDAFTAMLDPANWTQQAPEQLRAMLETIAGGPKFADLAMPHADAASAWRETLDYQKAASDMGSVMQAAWVRTYERYSKDHTLEDLQSGDVDEALKAWLKAANDELLETQRSKEFMDAQKAMVRAGNEIKSRQRDTAEAWSEMYQIPTRTEVDDLTKIVHELRRELRQVKRELASARKAKGS